MAPSGRAAAAALLLAAPAAARNNLLRTPPMGWMSWQVFRCNLNTSTDDCSDPLTTSCISEALYRGQADAAVANGLAAAGFSSIHMDDCWPAMQRDSATNELVGDPVRFPSGMKALGDYIHSKNLSFALYTAESTETCGGYPGSQGYEQLDAKTFAEWGVDYLKVDGCGDPSYYPAGYAAMGAALEASGAQIAYSCSWPAYIGDNETDKPFSTFIMDGCNLWRNWMDIQCSWGSLVSIINHWGQYGAYLAPYAGPGHWHDPDMLLIGAGCLTPDEERTQMAIWGINAAPLILGNDMRNVTSATESWHILTNPRAIAVDQDPLGQMGVRIAGNDTSAAQVWARTLANGDIAVALFNALGGVPPPTPCTSWNVTRNGYYHSCGGASGVFSGLTLQQAQDACCASPICAGLLYDASTQSGDYHVDTNCGYEPSSTYSEYAKPGFQPPQGAPIDISVTWAQLGLPPAASCDATDIWSGVSSGPVTGSYTATAVPYHGTAFVRLSCTL